MSVPTNFCLAKYLRRRPAHGSSQVSDDESYQRGRTYKSTSMTAKKPDGCLMHEPGVRFLMENPQGGKLSPRGQD